MKATFRAKLFAISGATLGWCSVCNTALTSHQDIRGVRHALLPVIASTPEGGL